MTASGRVNVAASIHLHGDPEITVTNRPANEHSGPYSLISLGSADLFVQTAAQCDALIRAACAAKLHLVPARLDGSIPDPDPALVENVATTGGVL